MAMSFLVAFVAALAVVSATNVIVLDKSNFDEVLWCRELKIYIFRLSMETALHSLSFMLHVSFSFVSYVDPFRVRSLQVLGSRLGSAWRCLLACQGCHYCQGMRAIQVIDDSG
jgi:hypothetical protein